jgi:hypothetical protein
MCERRSGLRSLRWCQRRGRGSAEMLCGGLHSAMHVVVWEAERSVGSACARWDAHRWCDPVRKVCFVGEAE